MRGRICATALVKLVTHHFDAVVLDLKLGAENGLSLIEAIKQRKPNARLVLLTGYASIATAVEAIKRGADDYLPKPIDAPQLLQLLRAAGGLGGPGAGQKQTQRAGGRGGQGAGGHGGPGARRRQGASGLGGHLEGEVIAVGVAQVEAGHHRAVERQGRGAGGQVVVGVGRGVGAAGHRQG